MHHSFEVAAVVALALVVACQPAPNGSAAARAAGDTGAMSAPAGPAAFSAADEAAIQAVDSTWAASIEKGDGPAATALYADDAVLLGSDTTTISGKADIGKALDGFAKARLKNVKLRETKVEGRGDLAYTYGAFSMIAGGTEAHGKYAEVLKRQPDGRWKYVVDSWSYDPAPKK